MWAEQTRHYASFLGLNDIVTVVDAPLKSFTLQNRNYDWYDIPADALDELGAIDLLLVDGPPQKREDPVLARYPAFPLLRQRLSGKALIFVDDANRASESKMVELWTKEEAGWDARWFDTIDGMCMLTRAT
jgi:hypothetical protein